MLACMLASFFLLLLLLFFFFLVDDLEGEFDLVGLFVGVEFGESLEESGHACGTSLDEVLKAQFLFGFRSPVNGFFALVFVVVGEVEDVGALELELAHAGDVELTAVEALVGKISNGFFGGGVNDLVYLRLDGFLLVAQGAQGF